MSEYNKTYALYQKYKRDRVKSKTMNENSQWSMRRRVAHDKATKELKDAEYEYRAAEREFDDAYAECHNTLENNDWHKVDDAFHRRDMADQNLAQAEDQLKRARLRLIRLEDDL